MKRGVVLSRSHPPQSNTLTAPLIRVLAISPTRMANLMRGFVMASGIYQITNQANGKRYVGSAVNLTKRWRAHLNTLRHRRHKNPHLQCAYDKYGEEALHFTVLEFVDDSLQLIPREQVFLDLLSPEYNIAPIAGSALGVRHTNATRNRMSQAQRGHRVSEKTKRKISEALSGERHPNYGKHLSKEHRKKLGEAIRGERHHYYGKHLSKEHREKLSKALRGKPLSEETKRKISEGLMGHHTSEETKRKISLAQRGEVGHFYGQRHTKETTRKLSEAEGILAQGSCH